LQGGAGGGALGGIFRPTHPDLALLIDRLPKLSDATRQALLIDLLKASWPTLAHRKANAENVKSKDA
jgi:hypothetical protein